MLVGQKLYKLEVKSGKSVWSPILGTHNHVLFCGVQMFSSFPILCEGKHSGYKILHYIIRTSAQSKLRVSHSNFGENRSEVLLRNYVVHPYKLYSHRVIQAVQKSEAYIEVKSMRSLLA